MKKSLAPLLVILLAFSVNGHDADDLDLGSDSESSEHRLELPEPGATPGMVFFILDQTRESLSLKLTFGAEKKGFKRLDIAQERIAEAEDLLEENDPENAIKAIKLYSENVREANKYVQKLSIEKRGEFSREIQDTRFMALKFLEHINEEYPDFGSSYIQAAIENESEELGYKPTESLDENSDDME